MLLSWVVANPKFQRICTLSKVELGLKQMATGLKEWKEKEWETHINAIVTVHHQINGQTYHLIADKVQGDGGLEGFSSDGHAYQCYCDQDSVSTADRAKKQKAKITADLAKLETYKDFWEQTLQGVKLKLWVLVVPSYEDKDVLTHARKVAAALKKKKLRFLHSSFQACVCTDKEGFPIAYRRAVESGATLLCVSPGVVDGAAVSALVTHKPEFVENMDRKLKQALPPNATVSSEHYRNDLLTYYLKGSNILQGIERDVPAVHERLLTFIAEQTESIRLESQIDPTAAGPRLMETRRELKSSLAKLALSIDAIAINTLAWSTVVGWLGDCPLEFPEPIP
jgi:hypothetical protein